MRNYKRIVNSWIGLGAIIVAFGHAQPAIAGHPRFTKGEAMQHTQASALHKCRIVAGALNEVNKNAMWYCRFVADETIKAKCNVKNPPGWLGLVFSTANCPERWWLKNYKTGQQELHGCLYQMTKRGPFYNVRGNCRKGTRY